jgi:UDP-N-acetylglucosamine diphosphorylase/glucosamine-1-phosphate N-acetyltransferase
VAIFEDDAYENFLPLTYTRPAFDLRCGARSFRQRIADLMRAPDVLLFTRDYLGEYIESKERRPVNRPEAIGGPTLFINGLLIPDRALALRLTKASEGQIGAKDDRLVFICLGAARARELAGRLARPLSGLDVSQLERSATKRIDVQEARLMAHPRELLGLNLELLKCDLASLPRSRAGEVHARAAILGRRGDLSIGPGAMVDAGAVMDVRAGPIHIASNCAIRPNATIEGPAFIGPGTQVLPFARIHGGSSIGAACRIGGEVEAAVIHGHSDKAHAGFIGHSYVGEWVSLGAMTTTADLKNTYGTVKVNVRGQRIDTGETNIGAFIADYAKTSIGVLIYPGHKIGVAAQLHGTVIGDVPSFTMYAKTLGSKMIEAFFESVAESQRRMYGRRMIEQTAADITLLKKVFEITREERKAAGVVQGRFTI